MLGVKIGMLTCLSDSQILLLLVFPPHFLTIEVVVNASGQPNVLKMWLGLIKGMLPVKYLHSSKASFCVS